jgi:intraflagellar transport protein 46
MKPKPKITGWISSIADIHKSKPPAVVSYAKRMPDLEALMQEWPPEMEAALKSMKLPTGDLVSTQLIHIHHV